MDTERLQKMLNNRPSAETLAAAKEAKQAERESKIDAAIAAGAEVRYTTHMTANVERETQIIITDQGVEIFTEIPADINRCINCGYKITQVTYYVDDIKKKTGKRVCGMQFVTSKKKISFRKETDVDINDADVADTDVIDDTEEES